MLPGIQVHACLTKGPWEDLHWCMNSSNAGLMIHDTCNPRYAHITSPAFSVHWVLFQVIPQAAKMAKTCIILGGCGKGESALEPS